MIQRHVRIRIEDLDTPPSSALALTSKAKSPMSEIEVVTSRIRVEGEYSIPGDETGTLYRVLAFVKHFPSYQKLVLVQPQGPNGYGEPFVCTQAYFTVRYQLRETADVGTGI